MKPPAAARGGTASAALPLRRGCPPAARPRPPSRHTTALACRCASDREPRCQALATAGGAALLLLLSPPPSAHAGILADTPGFRPAQQPAASVLVLDRVRVEQLLTNEFRERLRALPNEQLVQLLDELLASQSTTAPQLFADVLSRQQAAQQQPATPELGGSLRRGLAQLWDLGQNRLSSSQQAPSLVQAPQPSTSGASKEEPGGSSERPAPAATAPAPWRAPWAGFNGSSSGDGQQQQKQQEQEQRQEQQQQEQAPAAVLGEEPRESELPQPKWLGLLQQQQKQEQQQAAPGPALSSAAAGGSSATAGSQEQPQSPAAQQAAAAARGATAVPAQQQQAQQQQQQQQAGDGDEEPEADLTSGLLFGRPGGLPDPSEPATPLTAAGEASSSDGASAQAPGLAAGVSAKLRGLLQWPPQLPGLQPITAQQPEATGADAAGTGQQQGLLPALPSGLAGLRELPGEFAASVEAWRDDLGYTVGELLEDQGPTLASVLGLTAAAGGGVLLLSAVLQPLLSGELASSSKLSQLLGQDQDSAPAPGAAPAAQDAAGSDGAASGAEAAAAGESAGTAAAAAAAAPTQAAAVAPDAAAAPEPAAPATTSSSRQGKGRSNRLLDNLEALVDDAGLAAAVPAATAAARPAGAAAQPGSGGPFGAAAPLPPAAAAASGDGGAILWQREEEQPAAGGAGSILWQRQDAVPAASPALAAAPAAPEAAGGVLWQRGDGLAGPADGADSQQRPAPAHGRRAARERRRLSSLLSNVEDADALLLQQAQQPQQQVVQQAVQPPPQQAWWQPPPQWQPPPPPPGVAGTPGWSSGQHAAHEQAATPAGGGGGGSDGSDAAPRPADPKELWPAILATSTTAVAYSSLASADFADGAVIGLVLPGELPADPWGTSPAGLDASAEELRALGLLHADALERAAAAAAAAAAAGSPWDQRRAAQPAGTRAAAAQQPAPPDAGAAEASAAPQEQQQQAQQQEQQQQEQQQQEQQQQEQQQEQQEQQAQAQPHQQWHGSSSRVDDGTMKIVGYFQ